MYSGSVLGWREADTDRQATGFADKDVEYMGVYAVCLSSQTQYMELTDVILRTRIRGSDQWRRPSVDDAASAGFGTRRLARSDVVYSAGGEPR